MRLSVGRAIRSQGGYTLVELIIALGLFALLTSAIGSVMLTTWRGTAIAVSQVEASSQIRHFEYFAYDDFATGNVNTLTGCTLASPCTSPIALSAVTYRWDGSNFLDRVFNGSLYTAHAATNVTAFSWYVDTNSTVVVSLTVTVSTYSESQTFRFYPRVNP